MTIFYAEEIFMELKNLFKIKYELLLSFEDEVEKRSFQTDEEREAYRKGFEKAIQLFFVENMEEILDPTDDKEAA